MKRILLLVVALILATSAAALAQSWILPIHHRDGGGWIEHPGAGYGGTSAWEGVGMDGVRRVYWSMDTVLGGGGSGLPGWNTGTPTFVYIEFYVPSDQSPTQWQPIESQIRGSAGEQWPNDPLIPWAGAWGTNHEYIGAENGTPGTWKSTGPGPHTPEDQSYTAGPNGVAMWVYGDSWLYAKWDFPWSIDHTWSMLRVTVVPEPGTLAAFAGGLFGLAGMAIRRRR